MAKYTNVDKAIARFVEPTDELSHYGVKGMKWKNKKGSISGPSKENKLSKTQQEQASTTKSTSTVNTNKLLSSKKRNVAVSVGVEGGRQVLRSQLKTTKQKGVLERAAERLKEKFQTKKQKAKAEKVKKVNKVVRTNTFKHSERGGA
ncbi:MAG: DUF7211 domain-containing protein [Bacilli bacterium]